MGMLIHLVTNFCVYTRTLTLDAPYSIHFNIFTNISPLSYVLASVLASRLINVRHTSRSRPPHLRAIRCKHILFSAGNILALELGREKHHAPRRLLHISEECPVSPLARLFLNLPTLLDAVLALPR
jgi:hypothetical protein